jgi:hypothetical protein
MRRIFTAAVLACACAMSLAARAEDLVVIESSVPTVPAGMTVGSGTRIEVPANGRVVLAAPSGQVVTINGPFAGAPPVAGGAAAAGSGEMLRTLSALLGNADRRQALGAVRATNVAWRQNAVKSLGDVLAIDTTDGGDACIYARAQPMLVHNPARHGQMSIEPMNGGDKVSVEWPEATAHLPWPAALPINDGDAFVFQQVGEDAAAIVTVHVLPVKETATDLDRAAQMAQEGCRDQARLLLGFIAKSAK